MPVAKRLLNDPSYKVILTDIVNTPIPKGVKYPEDATVIVADFFGETSVVIDKSLDAIYAFHGIMSSGSESNFLSLGCESTLMQLANYSMEFGKCMRFVTKILGEHSQDVKLRSSRGIVDSFPASGSLMMPDKSKRKRDDAAAVGFPERTDIVGNRNMKPLIYPRRVYSLIITSQISFSAPYEDRGVGITVSSTIEGTGDPKTACVDAYIILTPGTTHQRCQQQVSLLTFGM
jgi:hypothetical protein